MTSHQRAHDPNRPFTMLVRVIYTTSSFQRLSERCEGARSAAWFNNLLNGDDPWVVSPPPKKTWAALSKGLGLEEAVIRMCVAQEWFGIHGQPVEDPKPKPEANELEHLLPADRKLVLELIRRLVDVRAAEDAVVIAGLQEAIDSAPEISRTI